MRTIILIASLLLSGGAWADGSPLFVPNGQIVKAEAGKLAELQRRPHIISAERIEVNRAAIESTVITANVGGKDYRFVGGKVSNGVPNVEGWGGTDGAAIAVFSRSKDGGFSGKIFTGKRVFQVRQLGTMYVLVEHEVMPEKLK